MRNFEVLPPQPASPSLTRTEADGAQNAAIWQTFRTQGFVSVSGNWWWTRIPVLCLWGRYLGVTFFGTRSGSGFLGAPLKPEKLSVSMTVASVCCRP